MRRVLLVAAAAAALAVPAGATAASSPSPSRLEAQITALQKQVKTLSTTVTTLKARETEVEAAFAATFLFDVCQGAVTADLVQATWGVVDQLAQATQGKAYFGPQAALSDQQSCSDLTIQRQVAGAPPSLASLAKVIDFFYAP